MRLVIGHASLKEPCDFTRGEPLSTLIANEQYWFEADWDGRHISDIFIFKNSDVEVTKWRTARAGMGDRTDYKKGVFFGMVPATQVKCYRFLGNEEPPKNAQQQATPANTPKGSKPVRAETQADTGAGES